MGCPTCTYLTLNQDIYIYPKDPILQISYKTNFPPKVIRIYLICQPTYPNLNPVNYNHQYIKASSHNRADVMVEAKATQAWRRGFG